MLKDDFQNKYMPMNFS